MRVGFSHGGRILPQMSPVLAPAPLVSLCDTRYSGYCHCCRAEPASAPCIRVDFVRFARSAGPLWVNDTHSALNRTAVSRVHRAALGGRRRRSGGASAAASASALAISGARHAMGGQQFLSGGTLLDMRQPQSRALVRSRPGAHGSRGRHHLAGCHPRLSGAYSAARPGVRHPPEADRRRSPDRSAARCPPTSTAAASSAQPFVADIEGLEVDHANRASVVRCSRTQNTRAVSPRRRRLRIVRRRDAPRRCGSCRA